MNRTRILSALLGALSASGCGAASGSMHVETIASVRGDARDGAWALEARAFRTVASAAMAKNGFRLIVTPISDGSIGEVPLLDATAPTESFLGLNQYDADRQRRKLQRQAEGALAQLEARTRVGNRTEIINAIVGALDRFESDHVYPRRLLIILSNGFEQSSIVNMGDYDLKLNLPAIRQRLIDHLKATGQIVDLHGTDVCMIGTTNGDGHWADYNRMRGVRQFWNDYFAASGAAYIGIGPTIESCAPIATQGQ